MDSRDQTMKRFHYCWLLLGLLSAQGVVAQETLIEDFEGGNYQGWTVEGNAFGSSPASGKIGAQQAVVGFRGGGLVNTFLAGDSSLGSLTSSEFPISEKYLAFLIGGGKHPGETGIELYVAGELVRSATGRDDERLEWV